METQVACGITNKPKEPVVDIDAADADNQLAASEYVEDIYKFYKLIEVPFLSWISLLMIFRNCLFYSHMAVWNPGFKSAS